jgi:hypothetical protein
MTHFSFYPRRADDQVLTLRERLAELQSQMQALTMTLRRMEQAYAYYQQLLAATTTQQALLELAADFTTVFGEDARSLSLDQVRLTLLQWKFSALRIVPLMHALQQLTEQENSIRQVQQTCDASTLYTRCQLCQRFTAASLLNEAEAFVCVPCQNLLATEPPPGAPFFISGRVEVAPDGQAWLKTYLANGPQLNLSQSMRAGRRVWLFQDRWVSGTWLLGEHGEDLVWTLYAGHYHRTHSLLSLSGSLLAIAADRLPSPSRIAETV